jgi:hypothetical protein
MREIRNNDGKLVCRVDESAGTVEISVKGCKTLIHMSTDGTIKVVNTKDTAA